MIVYVVEYSMNTDEISGVAFSQKAANDFAERLDDDDPGEPGYSVRQFETLDENPAEAALSSLLESIQKEFPLEFGAVAGGIGFEEDVMRLLRKLRAAGQPKKGGE